MFSTKMGSRTYSISQGAYLKPKRKRLFITGFLLMVGLIFKPTFASDVSDKSTLLKQDASAKPSVLQSKSSPKTEQSKPIFSRRGKWQQAGRWKLSSRGGFESYSYLDMEATAYDPGPISCGPHANGYTATGMRAGHGVVAVDPRVIPLGTRVYVEGYGYAIAADIGSAIKGNRIDLCFNTYGEAIRYGRRPARVYLLGR